MGIGATKVAVDYDTGWYITESQGEEDIKKKISIVSSFHGEIIKLQIIGAILYPTFGLK